MANIKKQIIRIFELFETLIKNGITTQEYKDRFHGNRNLFREDRAILVELFSQWEVISEREHGKSFRYYLRKKSNALKSPMMKVVTHPCVDFF